MAPSLKETCDAIAELCAEGGGASPTGLSTAPDAAVVLERAAQLRALGEALAAAQAAAVPRRACATRTRRWVDLPPQKEHLGSQILSTLVVFGVTLPYYVCVTYRSWFIDEGFAIYRNPDARGETPMLEVLKHDFWGTPLNPPEGYVTHKSFRPLVTFMYALEWQLSARLGFEGQEMQPMRAVSCLIHSLNSVLLLWLLRRLRVSVRYAVLGASLFAAHPVHVENIVYLVGRADALATSFSLMVVLFYLRMTLGQGPRLPLWSYFVMAMLTSIAGLCKEPGFTILFFLSAAEVVLRSRWRHFFGLLLLFTALGGIRTWYVGGTEAGFGYVDTPIRYQEHILTRTLSYLFQHAFYAKLLILPWHQSWDYSYDALPMLSTFDDVRLLAIFTAYLSVAALAANGLWRCRRFPLTILGLGLVVVPFIPASNLFFLVGTTIGERLLYPCTVGWSVLVASFIARATGRWRVLRVLAAVLLLVYVWNSTVRMGHWRNTQTLFETDAQHWDRSAKVLHSKASERQARGDLEGALKHYLQSLEVFDDQAITDYCIARCLINLGRFQEAYQRFDKILNGHGIGLHDGNDFLWMTDLGYLLVVLNSNEQGAHYLQEGLQRMPYSGYGWNALGVAKARMGQLEQALHSLNEGLQVDPDSASLWNNLAVVYAHGGAWQQANEAMQRAVISNGTLSAVVHNARVLTGQVQGSQPVLDLYIPLPGRR